MSTESGDKKNTASGGNRSQRFTKTARKNEAVAGSQNKFEGRCPDLKGHIYDCTDSRQSDMFQ